MYLCGSEIKWADHVKHLGNVVNKHLSDDNDCRLKQSAFIGSVNKLLGNYGKLQRQHLCYLFKSHCCSYYGSQLWNVTSCGFKACCTQWNKAVRHIKGLHYRTHTWILGPVTNQYHISVQLFIKSLKFIYTVCLTVMIQLYHTLAKYCHLMLLHLLVRTYLTFAINLMYH